MSPRLPRRGASSFALCRSLASMVVLVPLVGCGVGQILGADPAGLGADPTGAGTAGTVETSGIAGTTGASGATGVVDAAGTSGGGGTTGAAGAMAAGVAGATGKAGSTGASGTTGAAGAMTTGAAGGKAGSPGTAGTAPPTPGTAVINWTDVHQPMTGFGGADRDNGDIPDATMTQLFDPDKGIGLSVLRTSIEPTGLPTNGSWSNLQRAQKLGVLIWAAPWTPPKEWKTGGSFAGGSLMPASYPDWAARLASYVTMAKANGVTIWGVSPQNEPNLETTYDSCVYSPFEYMNFLKVVGPVFAALTPRPKLLVGEPNSWTALWDYSGTIEKDATASAYADVYAAHEYGSHDPTVPMSSAKPIWETEVSTFDSFSADIGNGLRVAKLVHDAIIIGNAQAWTYWWLIGQGTDNEGLMGSNGKPSNTKRMFTVGNFSKFVRPGFVRVGTTGGPTTLLLSAYKNPAGKGYAIVGINNGTAPLSLAFTFNGMQPGTVVPWVTSASLDLAAQPAVTTTATGFTGVLPAQSVTTFVGTAP
jgi:glucuronoarabinoxylan endo-1,4-beta-xylanase